MTKEQQTIIDLVDTDYTETGTGEVAMVCPFCETKKKKLYISPEGRFICFVCSTKGNSVFSFVSQYYGCSFAEARNILGDQSLAENRQTVEPTGDFNLLYKLVQLNQKTKTTEKTIPQFPSNTKLLADNFNNPESYPYLNYLYRRGITLQQIKHFKIRYLVQGKIKRVDKPDLAITHSIVFYTYNQHNQPVYWSTRSIDPHPYIKSLNAIADKNKISRKDIIYNMNSINHSSKMVICEGIFNALTCTNDSYTGIATLGKAITDNQIKLMTKLNPQAYYVFLDNDAKEQELKLAKRLFDEGIDYSRIYLVKNPYGNQDANDLGMAKVKQLLDQAKPITLGDMILLAR